MRVIGRLSRFVWGLNLALVVAVLVVLFISFDVGIPAGDDTVRAPMGGQEVNRAGAADASAATGPDLNFIVEQDIFGDAGRAVAEKNTAETAQAVNPQRQPAHELSLRLLGTIVDTDQDNSYAILQDTAAKGQDIYRVGDVLGDVRIESIEQNKVVVMSNGLRQVLSLDLTGQVSRTSVAADRRPAPRQINVNNNEIVRVVSNSQRQINTRLSAAGMAQASQLLGKVSLSPHVTEGKPDGLRLSGLGDSVLAQLAGFRDGDLIHSINGHPVSDQKRAAQVLRKARKLGVAQVEFARGQENKSLAFHAGAW